ncbi:type II toxin-antitoxin system VapC family toxin [Afifella sp. JA880]|uniref:type II toxin-antitoxin system VapC family toxin n=1 Tax=Afifella sp. JA880 TaxID=2975280 RepID=UPI0021BB629C|nr:type II toxin-antitoxin system VapC family toxin [Afifella sp. JA880]MCT8268952.1 type II toxin-antitoxin system VapC family toxin [Afifella sp. JA880]
MIVDASALLAILFGEPEAEDFSIAIGSASARAISAVNYVEAGIRADRTGSTRHAGALDEIVDAFRLEIASVTSEQGILARQAYGFFGKGRHPAGLNLGDCFAYALAKTRAEPLLFKGNDFIHTDIEPAL